MVRRRFEFSMRWDTVALIVLLAAAATNVAISIYAVWRARKFRRLLASLPLLGFLGVGLNIFLGISRDPTSHNLWPFELLITCAAGIIYSIAFLGLQALLLRRKQRNDHEIDA